MGAVAKKEVAATVAGALLFCVHELLALHRLFPVPYKKAVSDLEKSGSQGFHMMLFQSKEGSRLLHQGFFVTIVFTFCLQKWAPFSFGIYCRCR
jgi:hypothetical protein